MYQPTERMLRPSMAGLSAFVGLTLKTLLFGRFQINGTGEGMGVPQTCLGRVPLQRTNDLLHALRAGMVVQRCCETVQYTVHGSSAAGCGRQP